MFTRIAAVRSSLDALAVELNTIHLVSCVVCIGTVSAYRQAEEISNEKPVDELRAVLVLFLK